MPENSNPPPVAQFPPTGHPAAQMPPQPQPPVWIQQQPPRRSSCLGRLGLAIMVVIFLGSLIMNFLLLGIVGQRAGRTLTQTVLAEGDPKNVVAVFPINGLIDERASQDLAAFCKEIENDDAVKAVVLRVESPGGGVTQANQMHEQIVNLKSKKPVIISMGGVAASGGYYISAPADEIIAEPTTITGSIGVLMTWVVVREGLSKIGVEPIVLKSTHAGPWKDELSIFDEPTQRQREHLQSILDSMQAMFEQVVRDGRGEKLKTRESSYTATVPSNNATQAITVSETEPFNGKIYMAQDALHLGLIDEIGFQDKAIANAKARIKVENAKVVQYAPHRGLFEKLFEGKANIGVNIEARTLDELQTPRMQMLWRGQ